MATAPTASDDARLYVELDAVDTFLQNMLIEAESCCSLEQLGVQNFDIIDSATELSGNQLYERFFRGMDNDTPEYLRSSAHSCLLAASLFGWLATDEAREFCQRQSLRLVGLADEHFRKAAANG